MLLRVSKRLSATHRRIQSTWSLTRSWSLTSLQKDEEEKWSADEEGSSSPVSRAFVLFTACTKKLYLYNV